MRAELSAQWVLAALSYSSRGKPNSWRATITRCTCCVPAAELETEAAAVVDRLVRNAPLSLRAMKATINRQMALRDSIAHDDTDELVRAAMRSADAKEGVRARMERRDADFSGT